MEIANVSPLKRKRKLDIQDNCSTPQQQQQSIGWETPKRIKWQMSKQEVNEEQKTTKVVVLQQLGRSRILKRYFKNAYIQQFSLSNTNSFLG